jgi:LPS export ABC transporter protein LptC
MILASMPRRPISICALALGVLLFAASAAPAAPPTGPIFELRNMTYVASEGAVNEVVLDAETAQVFPAQNEAHLQDVHAHLQSPGEGSAPGVQDRGSLDMQCDRGTFSISTGDFVAEGNVRGVTGDGRRFQTTRLDYNRREGLVTTDQPVLIQDETGTYRGGGFRYYVRENRFRLVGGAEVLQEP